MPEAQVAAALQTYGVGISTTVDVQAEHDGYGAVIQEAGSLYKSVLWTTGIESFSFDENDLVTIAYYAPPAPERSADKP